MAMIIGPIVENVGAGFIETYLKGIGIKRADEDKGVPVVEWVNKLLANGEINIEEFEEFLFSELLLGKRKLIRIYKLDSIKHIKYPEDWIDKLMEKYEITSLEFNAILKTYVNPSENRKIAAIHSEENEKGELTRLQMLFVCHVQTELGSSYAYIPVDIDFIKMTMCIKAWNKYGLLDESSRADALLEHIKKIMTLTFKVTYKSFGTRHRRVLYNMSKGLVDDIYNKIPAYNQISILNDSILKFEQDVFSELPIVIRVSKGH